MDPSTIRRIQFLLFALNSSNDKHSDGVPCVHTLFALLASNTFHAAPSRADESESVVDIMWTFYLMLDFLTAVFFDCHIN